MAIRDLAVIYFKNDEAAVNYIVDFLAAWHIWDDLIDKDKPITDESINQAFINAFIKLPRNTFYQANFAILNPLMENAFVSWFAANGLEQRNENLRTAYDLRNTYLNIVIACANIIGGVEWASLVAIDVQKKLHDNDSFEEYVTKLNAEKNKE
jgi:hypothetical protein